MSRFMTAMVAFAGFAIAAYLTVVHYTGGEPVCAIAHGCATVQKSSYAELGGVPVAVLGVAGYLGILGSLVKDTETTRSITALLAVTGWAFSLWLTSVEVFRLDAICIWCVGSAICMTLLAALATTRLLRPPSLSDAVGGRCDRPRGSDQAASGVDTSRRTASPYLATRRLRA